MTAESLTIATRAWTVPKKPDPARPRYDRAPLTPADKWRQAVLIVDTETTIDAAQRLMFGVYRFGSWRDDGSLAIAEEGFFHADDLPTMDPDGYAHLVEYVASHAPESASITRGRSLRMRTLTDFLESVLWEAITQDALIVGFNMPYDISRLACRVTEGRGKHRGGFSFVLWQYRDERTGKRRDNQYRPRIRITQIDSKRARIDITQPKGRPSGPHGQPVIYRPGFLDLRTLAFALTDRGYSLRSACEAFGADAGKAHAEEHGHIDDDYIAYARQDGKATGALLVALRREYDRHPIDLDPCRAYSPASVAKAYFRAMGITPRLALQPDFPPEHLGYAMAAYYGGRVECAIRRTPVPVVYTDTLSMYPTVNTNLGLWRYHIAERVEIEDCTAEAQAFLDGLTLADLLDAATWPRLTFYGQIIPAGDILPVRAKYGAHAATFNIGVNPLTDDKPHWYAGPDLAASVILTGTVPRLLRAFRLVPVGVQAGLHPVALRGLVTVDPASGDFFRTVIEERKRAKHNSALSPTERDRLDKALKCIGSSGAYGVFVELNPEEAAKPVPITVYGPDDTPFTATTTRPEQPGAVSFPPLASLITAGARLMLALIERLVTDAGGCHAFCDTDSMAIVATETGGLVPCKDGDRSMPDGTPAIRALSWAEVDRIAATLDRLNPYDRAAVPEPVLKIEAVNFDPDGHRRHVWCLAIASKRYALFTVDDDGTPLILPGSDTKRHGLGYLIDPKEKSDNPDALTSWEYDLWEAIVRERLGLPVASLAWADRPAVMRHTVSSPDLLRAFAAVNHRKPYAKQVKPFNFMLAATVTPFGLPGPVGQRLALVTPYLDKPSRWDMVTWYDRHTGTAYDITTSDYGMVPGTARVRSLGAIARQYPFHPEAKRNGPDGLPCGPQTEGLLTRRPVIVAGAVSIGKEAHRLDERDLAASLSDVQNVWTDDRRSPWTVATLPRLRAMAATPGGLDALAAAVCITPRELRTVLASKSTPRTAVRSALVRLAGSSPDPAPRVCAACGEPMTSERRGAIYHKGCRDNGRKRVKRAHLPAALAAD